MWRVWLLGIIEGGDYFVKAIVTGPLLPAICYVQLAYLKDFDGP